MKADETPAWLTAILDRLERIEAAATPQLAAELNRKKWDADWERTHAVARIVDPDERAAAILAGPQSDHKQIFGHMSALEMAQTLAVISPTDRERWLASVTPERRIEIAIATRKPPARVRLTLANPLGHFRSPPQRGARRSDDYPGVRLIGSAFAGTEQGVIEKIVRAPVYEGMLRIDPEFADAVAAGVVIATPLTDDESRRMLYAEHQANQSTTPSAAPAIGGEYDADRDAIMIGDFSK